jgi:DNA-binding transcriptional LysR family regulator
MAGAGGAVNLKTFDLNLLVVFDAVFHERNLTRAGERLGLTQSAVSHALNRLRQALDDELFVRGPDAMMPTARAQEIREPVREALEALRMAVEPQAFRPAEVEAKFVIAINNYVALTLAPHIAKELRKEAPNLRLMLRPSGTLNVLDRLDDGTIDLAIAGWIEGGERFKCVKAITDEFVGLVCNQNRRAIEPLTTEGFAAMPHLEITSGGYGTRFIDEILESRGFTRRIVLGAPLLSLPSLLPGSDLIAVLPRRQAGHLGARQPLAVLPLPFASPPWDIAMIWHRRHDKHPMHVWLRKTVRQTISALRSGTVEGT